MIWWPNLAEQDNSMAVMAKPNTLGHNSFSFREEINVPAYKKKKRDFIVCCSFQLNLLFVDKN